jgi:DNA-binding CsgD family transcriptional regulator
MTPEQAWDAVLSIQTDIERIVSQAVRVGRVSPNDSEDAVNTAMVTCVGLAESYDGTIGTFAAYALATVRRKLQGKGHAITTDAMERTGIADISANSRQGGLRPSRAIAKAIPQLDSLTLLERRVASLLAAGKPIGQIARVLGTTIRGVKTVAGMAEAKIRRMEKTGSPRESAG